MLGTHGMKSAGDGVLYITEHGIHPFERRVLNAFSTATAYDTHMKASSLTDCRKTGQAVIDDSAAGSQIGLGVTFDFIATETAGCPQVHSLGAVGRLISFDDGNERCFMVSAAPRLTWPLTADVGVIHLDTTFSLQLKCRNPTLMLGEQVDSQEPLSQCEFGTHEDGATRQRSLAVTVIHLTTLDLAIGRVTAFWTGESSWPTQVEQCRIALFFATIAFKELGQTETFLELNWILRYDGNLANAMILHMLYFRSTGWNVAEIGG